MCQLCLVNDPLYQTVSETGDAPAGPGTPYMIDVGDTFFGDLSSASDDDWVRIDLSADSTYEISLDGVSLSDPYLRVYDSNGSLVTENDDGGGGLNSRLVLKAKLTHYKSPRSISRKTGLA